MLSAPPAIYLQTFLQRASTLPLQVAPSDAHALIAPQPNSQTLWSVPILSFFFSYNYRINVHSLSRTLLSTYVVNAISSLSFRDLFSLIIAFYAWFWDYLFPTRYFLLLLKCSSNSRNLKDEGGGGGGGGERKEGRGRGGRRIPMTW